MIKKRFLNLNSLSAKFFLNYVLFFILIIVILFSTIVGGFYIILTKYNIPLISRDEIFPLINNHGVEYTFKDYKIANDGYIEYLDSNLVVIDSYKSIHKKGYKYTLLDIKNIKNNDDPAIEIYDSKTDNAKIIIYNPNLNRINSKFVLTTMKNSILFLILSFLTVFILFAKITSTKIVGPIKKLAHGVDEISRGNYNINLDFKSKNELALLKESINHMACTIENEISLREKAENNRKRLILNISHDLKTPLTNVLGYAETLHDQQEYNKKYLDIIISNSKKANNMIQDLFQLSHLESSAYKLDSKEHDLCEFMRRILVGFIFELEEKNISYDFHIPDESIYLDFDANKLERALSNLINNSIKYAKNHIIISVIDNFDWADIIIEDIGPGIDYSMANDIFEPFVREDTSRNSQTGGTGLGLAITKAIIEHHGGCISLDTNYSKGCRFIIKLNKF